MSSNATEALGVCLSHRHTLAAPQWPPKGSPQAAKVLDIFFGRYYSADCRAME